MENQVELKTETLGDLFGICSDDKSIKSIESPKSYNLSIPSYQRIYCWQDKHVVQLLDDICNLAHKPYHLGSIILHKKTEVLDKDIEVLYDIVDGQQRLVTLLLLLLELYPDVDTPLANATFESEDAQSYIAYNKSLISSYAKNVDLKERIANILSNLQFSVLIISEGTLDLAYTFFSNQNSRGKSLTDYDLLKAHHLRFIHIPEQAKHLAERWDSLVLSSDNDASDRDLGRTFGIYLFRLRKWMRKREWSNDEKYKVKTEFEAAPIIQDIPPFGEQFDFYETIQGGTHFFAYADHFIYRFKTFSKTNVFITLHEHLRNENHWWYRDVIEAFLFAYYLKFGTLYLEEALVVISRIISEHRYNNQRANLRSLFKHAAESEIIMMIDQASSPTFFLAEGNNIIKRLTVPAELNGTRKRYRKALGDIYNKLNLTKSCLINYN